MNNDEKLYTQEQLDIELLKQSQGELFRLINKIYQDINRIDNDVRNGFNKFESQQRWLLGIMGSGFLGILGLIAHGFKWII